VYETQWTEDLECVSVDWEALAERVRATPFLRPGWIAAWWRAFGSGRLRILSLRAASDGVLHALMPLRQKGGVLSSLTNWHSHESGFLADSPEAAGALLASVLSLRRRRIALDFLDDRQADLLAAAAAAGGCRVIRRVRQRSPYVVIDGDWSAYEQSLGRKVRSEIRRRHRLLCERGEVSFEVESGERIDESLDEGLQIAGSGWKAERGTAILSRPETTLFYRDVARWAAGRGWTRLAFLRLDGRPVAFNLCLEHGGAHYLLKVGFDPAYRDLGPGKLLRQWMLARAFEIGLKRYEFLGEVSSSKLECTTTMRSRLLVQAFRPTPLGLLDWAAFAVGRPLVKRIVDAVRHRPREVAVAAP
jgi:CelD/BcsL family acetyltransferase involved in cellulose biosynthesis